MFGHCADSHTVCRPSPRARRFRLWKLSPTGAFARSHCGLGARSGGESSIWMSWDAPAIVSILTVRLKMTRPLVRLAATALTGRPSHTVPFGNKHVEVGCHRFCPKLSHHQCDLAAMVGGMVSQMLQQVPQADLRVLSRELLF